MSSLDEPVGVDDLVDDAPTPNGSLSSRMRQRAEYLESHQTEKFPIPGYEDVLEVELRALGYARVRRVITNNEKIRDPGVREIATIADQLVTATEGFFEVLGEERRQIDDDWLTLARRLPNCPDELTPRRAILHVVGDKRIHFLAQDWGEWAKSVKEDVDEELGRDFATTP